MHVSTEGKIGIGLALLGIGGGAAMTIWPTRTEIGWAMMAFAAVGVLLLLGYHCWDVGWLRWPYGQRRSVAGRRLAMSPPPESAVSLRPNRRIPVIEAARRLYGHMGDCEFRRTIDRENAAEVSKLERLIVFIILRVETFGIRPPSSMRESIRKDKIPSMRLRLFDTDAALIETDGGGGSYDNLAVRDADLEALMAEVEKMKNDTASEIFQGQ